MIPEAAVYDSFTYHCVGCGGVVTVIRSETQAHQCNAVEESGGLAEAWEKGRRAGQMDPNGLYPTPNPYEVAK